MNYKYYYFLFLSLVIISCKPVEKVNEINYMQNIEAVALQTAANNQVTTLQPGDQLMILVSAKDNDVVKPYNQNYSSSEIVQNTVPAAGNTPNTGINSISGPTYIIDSEGNIDFSGIGKLHPTGKSLVEFKEELREEIKKYVINPTINIRLTNFKVQVLGEVVRPGEYTIIEGQGNIFKALALAGDTTIYGKRDQVLIVRTENGEITQQYIDLKDANFINSPFYNLKQGDVIYIAANKNREITAKTNPNTGLYISLASVAVGAVAIIISVFTK